jgi:hypothetical protein
MQTRNRDGTGVVPIGTAIVPAAGAGDGVAII